MPGQLVHTNKILVLLGDNWFVDRSASQAGDIVSRRIKGNVTLFYRNNTPLISNKKSETNNINTIVLLSHYLCS